MSGDTLGWKDRNGNPVTGERWEVAHKAMLEAAERARDLAVNHGIINRMGPKHEIRAAVHAALDEHDARVASQTVEGKVESEPSVRNE